MRLIILTHQRREVVTDSYWSYAVHDVSIACLADAADTAVFDANVRFDDAQNGVQDERVGDDRVQSFFPADQSRLPHAFAQHLTAAEFALVAVHRHVLLHLDDEPRVAQTHLQQQQLNYRLGHQIFRRPIFENRFTLSPIVGPYVRAYWNREIKAFGSFRGASRSSMAWWRWPNFKLETRCMIASIAASSYGPLHNPFPPRIT